MGDHVVNVPLFLVGTTNGWDSLFDWPGIPLEEVVMMVD